MILAKIKLIKNGFGQDVTEAMTVIWISVGLRCMLDGTNDIFTHFF